MTRNKFRRDRIFSCEQQLYNVGDNTLGCNQKRPIWGDNMSEEVEAPLDQSQLEAMFLKRQIELKDKEIAIKARELTDLEAKKTLKFDPVVIGIAAALLGFLGNVVATYLQGRNSLDLEKTKHEASRALETDKFRSSIIIEAIKTGDPAKAAKNIEFFLQAGFIEDQTGKISKYIAERANVPVLPSAVTGAPIQAGEPVDSLAEDDVTRKIASGVGMLTIDGTGTCTAWLVSSELALTADYCFASAAGKSGPLTLQLGFLSNQRSGKIYPIDKSPIEVNKEYGFALLRVKGHPGQSFVPIPLKIRAPVVGEELIVLHHSNASALAVTSDTKCRVVASPKAQKHSFEHTCSTIGGSGGAPVLARSDLALLGLHHSGDQTGSWNVARRMDEIAASSVTLNGLLKPATVVKK